MSMRSFVRAAEIWLPSPDGRELVFGDGLYGPLAAFEAASRAVRFKPGEGLPGEAWESRRPVLMKSLKDPRFRRIAAAEEAGLTAGIALPIFAGASIRAVVVLLCGDDAAHVGAIEIWRHDPEEDAQIGLADGYFGGAELFEAISRMKRFGRGFGVPGAVWASGMPLVLRDVCRSERFLRQEEALRVGLSLGLGLPAGTEGDRTWVMVFLSALGTPIAERFEIWLPDGEGRLVYDAGLSEDDAPRPALLSPGDGFIGRVLAEGGPAVTRDCAAEAPWLVGPEERAGPYAALAIPTLDPGGAIRAVTVWRF